MIRLSVHTYRVSVRIIKIQIICLLALILTLPAGVWAKPTTPEQARTVVENWLALDATPLGVPLGQTKEVKTTAPEQARTDEENRLSVDTAPLDTPQARRLKKLKPISIRTPRPIMWST